MKPPPSGWPRLSPSIFYDDAAAAIDWLCDAFGFEGRLKVQRDDGRIEHSELTYGESAITVGQTDRADRPTRSYTASPRSVNDANTHSLMLFGDDADAPCARARSARAAIVEKPAVHNCGAGYWVDGGYRAVDPEGHHWWFVQRLRG